jgi:hypothetical protein
MPHMDTKIDIIYDIINSFPISPARQEDIKEKIRDFGAEEWNRGYDKCLYNQACCDTDEISKRGDLQDQIDELQQQVGELELLVADTQKRSADILDVIGWERYKKKSDCPGGNLQVGDTQLPIKSRFYVEFDRIENDPGIGPRTYRDFMIVFAQNKWYAENKVRIAYPYPHEKNFETFLLQKQEA